MIILHVTLILCIIAILVTLVYLRFVRDAVFAIILFVLNTAAIAFFLIVLNLEFLAIITLILYIGAVAVLFLFVVIAVISKVEIRSLGYRFQEFFAFAGCLLLGAKFVGPLFVFYDERPLSALLNRPLFGEFFEVELIMNALYNNYFSVLVGIALLLLTSMIASIFVTLFSTGIGQRSQ